MSPREERERPATMSFLTVLATSRTASNSSFDAMGKPASMISTPSFSSWRAIWTFWKRSMLHPGDCSPSRRVVSKIRTREETEAPFEEAA
ncbi:MAG: hypothetical protein A3J27_05265 [Candidatus Tectomicrobia bacterium RIFCSPLOWO2_12_FULL_69_37]|nr:MAG: hypothetical protein A3J27_05265 [Candidatus Tectomicrobia bacterium RIFCSPLOWO2_12_FULL_69_37]